jgi:hypothetical protein
MNSKNTWVWFLVAAILFATIFVLDRHFRPGPPAALVGWPNFQLSDATSIEVIPKDDLEIRADQTNDNWFLTKPYAYPAQAAGIHALLDSLDRLVPDLRISAGDLRHQPTAEQDYGFDVPQVSLAIQTPHQQWQLKIGRTTAPGNQVYLRVVGVDGAFVTDSAWLRYLPKKANDWRDTSLVGADRIYDWILLTNGTKVIELKLDPTNHLWRMTFPLTARADSDRINLALQGLRTGRVESFVTDDPRADLTAYELQPANLDLWLGHGGSLSDGLHLGKTLTNNPALLYARREGWNGVISTLGEPLSPWRGTVADFRNSRLIDSTLHANEIEVRVDNGNHFILDRAAGGVWQVAGETYPADADVVQNFINLLAGLRATEYVNDAVTAPDLQAYGLAKPGMQITLRPVAGDTNQALVQLSFSAQTNGAFARRSDEDSIYRVDPAILNQIPEVGWRFRERRVWKFDVQDVTQITIHQDGKTRQIVHNGKDQWALAPGSPGEVFGPTIEETARALGELAAFGWLEPKVTSPADIGVTTNSLQIEVKLKKGQTYGLQFGTAIQDSTVAVVSLDGEPWAMVLPVNLYQLILSYLTIPAKFN